MNLDNTISARSGLTASNVLDIRRLHDVNGLDDAHLSRIFAVSRKTIYNIVNRKTWKHVPAPVTVRGYKGYSIYPDGRVFSKASGSFLSTINRATGPAVRLKRSDGSRKTVAVENLLRTGYRST